MNDEQSDSKSNTEESIKINTGGMYRCCIQEIQQKGFEEVHEIVCKYCDEKLTKHQGIWRTDINYRFKLGEL